MSARLPCHRCAQPAAATIRHLGAGGARSVGRPDARRLPGNPADRDTASGADFAANEGIEPRFMVRPQLSENEIARTCGGQGYGVPYAHRRAATCLNSRALYGPLRPHVRREATAFLSDVHQRDEALGRVARTAVDVLQARLDATHRVRNAAERPLETDLPGVSRDGTPRSACRPW